MAGHLHDVDADFRAIYHLSPDQALQLSGPAFLALAWRLPAYQGAIAARAQAEEERTTSKTRADGSTEVESTPVALAASPLGDLIDHVTV